MMRHYTWQNTIFWENFWQNNFSDFFSSLLLKDPQYCETIHIQL